jgi:hypothetical protein
MTYSQVTLEAGQAFALPRRDRQTICVLDHALWLSQQGRLDDVVATAGDCVTLSGRGLIVAQALSERTSFRVACTESAGVRWITRARDTLRSVFAAASRTRSA